jgi:hypothetical protein
VELHDILSIEIALKSVSDVTLVLVPNYFLFGICAKAVRVYSCACALLFPLWNLCPGCEVDALLHKDSII